MAYTRLIVVTLSLIIAIATAQKCTEALVSEYTPIYSNFTSVLNSDGIIINF